MNNTEIKTAEKPKNIECMKSELHGIPVVYYIDRVEGVVTGVMKVSGTEVIRLVQRHLMSKELSEQELSILMLWLPDEIKATAHCHPDDTFVVEEGLRCVNDKLTYKFNRAREDVLLKYYEYLTKRVLVVEKCFKKYPMKRLVSSENNGKRNVVNRAVEAMNEFRYILQYGHSSKWK